MMHGIKESLANLRDRALIAELLEKISAQAKEPMRVMEVCGTHTMAIFRHGLRSLLPANIELISGPGCPVCVTAAGHIDSFIALANKPGVHITTFGDLYRVPGSAIGQNNSLAQAAGNGARIDMVYSPMEALSIARANPDETVVFLGIGFETTTPTVAATILAAREDGIDNFMVYSVHKLMPPALIALFNEDMAIDGLLCPGHVSSIIGAVAYEPLAGRFGLPCVVAGFEAADILQALLMLLKQRHHRQAKVENAYTRVVSWEGNPRARAVVDKVFRPASALWRGLGEIPVSGLEIRPEYQQFDAISRLAVRPVEASEPPGCRCGEILKGLASPESCPLFGKRCTPVTPVGPCMVSSEGTCAAFYKFGITGA
jgi:hydrogenase expression/formation protein HypD